MTHLMQLLQNLTRDPRGTKIIRKADIDTLNDEPLRCEIFTVQQLEQLAHSLAREHEVDPRGGKNQLLQRLEDNEKTLLAAYKIVTDATVQKRRVAPAAEWLLDNFYIVEEQIRTTRRHLPRQYSRELPKLVNTESSGFPRVYAIALSLICHADGKIDTENVSRFVTAYQTVSDLKLGELWAVPIMIRLALIENLCRVAIRVARGQLDRDLAHLWADRLITAAEKGHTQILLTVAEMAATRQAFSCAFIAELSRRLHGQQQNFSVALSWLDQRLAEDGHNREQVIHIESQNQAADQVSVGNTIGSLRQLSAIDWREFVETQSSVDRALREDPAGVYPAMDFATRDYYRHVVETTARRAGKPESAVAEDAVRLSQGSEPESTRRHVGYFLADEGRAELEAAAGAKLPLPVKLGQVLRKYPTAVYVGSILAMTAAFTTVLANVLPDLSAGWMALSVFAIAIASSQFSLNIVNWLATQFVPPSHLPRLDFSRGIPEACRTVVAVPTMFTSKACIDDMLEKLEMRYLGNRDAQLRFALLGDFKDAPTETTPADADLLAYVSGGISDLNRRYAHDDNDIFFVFHRPRRFNPRENVWMGYERKRGKLEEFNRFLLDGSTAGFLAVAGHTKALGGVRYVITLDSDTQLPRDSAADLVGTMAHPLNRPVFDEKKRRVTRGYTILQPLAAITLPSAQASWFSRLFAGEPGIDPYTRAISDVYQDMFGEGSFIGKGIYDVAMFEKALGHRLPENRILSHDLIEGSYVRAGLVSDVRLYEDYPSRYLADTARRHRWARGDWQIMRWLMPTVPSMKRSEKNPLSALSRWKIFDNLRRGMVPIAIVAGLALGWLVLPAPAYWTVAFLAVFALPVFLGLIGDATAKNKEASLRDHTKKTAHRFGHSVISAALSIAFLPYEAALMADAAVRTWIRLTFTRRHLLEWTTSSEAEQAASTSFGSILLAMWKAPVIALAAGIAVAYLRPESLAAAAPVLALWFCSPAFAWCISQPIGERKKNLTHDDVAFLRRVARRTWSFFEKFVNKGENWLPPDNFQEHPKPAIAHRTSPTNIGCALLANLAAHDFGYLPLRAVAERTKSTFATMELMERFRGHLYNWYDTVTLRPLHPLYVSTVDSGNLAGHLLTLRRGLLELQDAPVFNPNTYRGLQDTLEILSEALDYHHITNADATIVPAVRRARELLANANGNDLVVALRILKDVEAAAAELSRNPTIASDAEVSYWAQALIHQSREMQSSIIYFVPWLEHPEKVITLDKGTFTSLRSPLTLRDLAAPEAKIFPEVDRLIAEGSGAGWHEDALREMRAQINEASHRAARFIGQLQDIADDAETFADMDFSFLYDKSRELFTIGFNVSDHRLDGSFYDLLASEARLTSFVAVAQGQVPKDHWFALGRQVTGADGTATLLSWSGSMFEYLMPLLVMPNYENTLLDMTYQGSVARQIEYGRQRRVPWGISESGYNITDAQLNYQYRAFGVPGLGLKRGLADDLVIAPYATVMSLMVAPKESCRNMRRLVRDGRCGVYGFYEAVDYTTARLPRGQTSATVRSFMAHHQGMSLLSLVYTLCDKPMQRRFLADPQFRAVELLMHERVPHAAPIYPHAAETTERSNEPVEVEGALRIVTDPNTPVPEVHLLSNGRYHVMVNNAGAGYSRWKGLAVTRWREDAMRDNQGIFCYLRDVDTGDVWSTTYQPTLAEPTGYEGIFSLGRAEFRRNDHGIDVHVDINVSAEDDVEIRRMTLTNRSDAVRTIEFTTYAEVVLAPPAADAAHPAFSNLFVQTTLDRARGAILCTRRPRQSDEQPPWLVHAVALRGHEIGDATYETDRSAFLGRGNGVDSPAAMRTPLLGNSEGSVLDPIVAIRRTVTLKPHQVAHVDVLFGMAETRQQAEHLADRYREQRLADRVFEMAWTHSQVLLRQLNATEADAQVFARLAGSIIYASHHRRAPAAILAKNRRGQSGLWGYGISGDLPIVVVRISDPNRTDLVRQIVQAHAYWRMRGLPVDLVIANDDPSVYRQALYDQIMVMISSGSEAQTVDKPGGIFVRRAEQISEEDRVLLQTVARVVLTDSEGTLQEQVERRIRPDFFAPALKPSLIRRSLASEADTSHADTVMITENSTRNLKFFNGVGGFSADGREYVMILPKGKTTPAPWVNVIANPFFGTVVSESGSVYTWLENSHEFRLTPWNNDPITDASGEAVYLRDDETGEFWSPTPLPIRGDATYRVRHGFGYSVFECREHGVASEMTVFVAPDAPVKLISIKLRNLTQRARRLSATGYFEWVLGELRSKNVLHVLTDTDTRTGALFARNFFSSEFPGRIAFLDSTEKVRSLTADRAEFLGRNGTLAAPAAMLRSRLSGKTGAGLDPCAAMQTPLSLSPLGEKEVIFILGVGRDADDVRKLLERFKSVGGAAEALTKVKEYWKTTLESVQVQTPDPAIDLLANGWLLYQTLACRMWARTGFYQSGGAFGFRDQLQDSMALLHAEPAIFRQQLLRAAGHQFRQGDVQHWWHPPVGRGVRTHFSDDYLWLPFATCRYVLGTGDMNILNEVVPFLDGRPVNADEEAYYDLPVKSEESATLYDHCVRAIKNGFKLGAHGLPLIGCGDWNDGMNRVGEHGKGESVWLAFFLYDVLNRFGEVATRRNDRLFAEVCREKADELKKNIEEQAWDGKWYRRAYFDNGEPLGSAENVECQIDALPQSWSILSGAGDPERSRMAMEAVDERLVRRDARLIQLFDPPFDRSAQSPGYIQGYVPGVRENGGQYTHAAIWTIMAFAQMGDSRRAWELFNMVNPINHGDTKEEIGVYKAEPYVVAADVYAVPPHTGRGGWTWYTGSAGWMYRLLTESLLGLHREDDFLIIRPVMQQGWQTYGITFRHGAATYRIAVKNVGAQKESRVWLNQKEIKNGRIPLTDDGKTHDVIIECGRCLPKPIAPAPAPEELELKEESAGE